MATSTKPKYHIRQTKDHHPRFALELNGQQIASLSLENKHASRALAQIGKSTLSFQRRKGLKKDISLHLLGQDSPMGHFVANILSRGILTLGNTSFRWAPAKKSWLSWAWYDSEGNEVLRMRRKLNFFATTAAVHSSEKLDTKTEALLSLLGLHLLQIAQQGSAGHLLTSLDLRKERKAVRRA
jgi:hypothetical protein